ncbi:MAG: histone H1 [Lasallia pustulata]|uniref:Histone H1 n=1 Tax=Lasallia pustulata TaxID=136370 RepID=A0A5M8PP79_9LECA|nr:MAG: histone H1 [Lasallia pustulata]
MPPKKATPAASQKKTAAAPAHASYKDMIKEAILTLKDRSGSSRQAIKKYILANNKTAAATPTVFDTQFNKALRTGVEKGDFTQPKGTSGPVKLAKKDGSSKPAAPTTKSAAPKVGRQRKATAYKDAAPKKAGAPKKTATKPAAPKKTPTTKKAAAPKPKANTGTKRKTPVAAPAVVDVPKVLAKKAAPKKTAAKKSATPKKKAETTT